MPSAKCGVIAGCLALSASHVASVRQNVASVHKAAAESAIAVGAVETVSELMQERNIGTEELRQQLSEYVQAAVTPGAEGSFQSSLQSVVKHIEGQLEPQIKSGQGATQEKLDNLYNDLDAANTATTSAKQVAVGKDKLLYDCITDEKSKREDVEAKAAILATSTSEREAACQLQQDNRHFAYDAAPKNYKLSFACDHIKGNCNAAISNWRSSVLQKMYEDAEVALTADETKHAGLKKDCDAKTAAQAKAQSELDAATALWSEKRQECADVTTQRDAAICDFGSKSQAKCTAENAFDNMVAATGQAKGNADSEVDRQNEWTALSTTKCMLKKTIEKGLDSPISSAELEACMPGVNYANDVGTLDLKSSGSDAARETNACVASEISFYNGKAWNVPAGEEPKAAAYITEAFLPQLNPTKSNFAFCSA